MPLSTRHLALPDDSRIAEAVDHALPQATGAELLRRMADGETAALETLYQLCGARFYSMARQMTGDDGAAREIVQDCFLRLWHRASGYDPALSGPFTWCVMILRGLCLDHLRRTARRLPPPPDGEGSIDPGNCAAFAGIHLRETLNLIRSRLTGLTSNEQDAIRAALFDPATCEDLSRRWDIPVGSVKTRIHRAMEKLRRLLRPHFSP